MWRGDLCHFLVNGYGVAIRWAKFSASDVDFLAVVMVSQSPWVVHATDGGDDVAVFLQWFESAGEFVVLTRLEDLVVEGVDPIGNVDEHTAARFVFGGSMCGSAHAFQKGKCDETSEPPKGMTATDFPGLCLYVAHKFGGFSVFEKDQIRRRFG